MLAPAGKDLPELSTIADGRDSDEEQDAPEGADIAFAWFAVAPVAQPVPAVHPPVTFDTADRCIACHNGMTTPAGEDVSIGVAWRASMMVVRALFSSSQPMGCTRTCSRSL
mgnify:CR=1 FL=1